MSITHERRSRAQNGNGIGTIMRSRWSDYLPSLLTVLVLGVGLVAQWSAQSARIDAHERRITTLEDNYVPKAVHEAKEKAVDEQNAETQRRLTQIEGKLDMLIQRDYIVKQK
jgi:hypothetical protein